MQVFNRNVSIRGLTVFSFELVLIAGSMVLAAQLHGSFNGLGATPWKIALVTALCQLCFYYNDLYDLTVVSSSRELVIRLLQAAGAAAIVLAAAGFVVPSLILDPGTFVTALGVFVIAVLTWRLAFNYLARDPASRRARADHRHRLHRAHAGPADRSTAGLRLSPGRLRRRGRG